MRLSQFIQVNIEKIMEDWEAFARTMIPPAETMSVIELRDHAQDILLDIASEMDSHQSEDQREAKGKGLAVQSAKASFSRARQAAPQRRLRCQPSGRGVPRAPSIGAAAVDAKCGHR